MKSLEHLIRLVHEGKAEKGEKSSLEHAIRKIRETKLDDIENTKATRAGRFDTKMTESDLNYMGSGTGGEPKMHAEDGKKKKTDEAVGTIGTDDYQGNQFKSVRTQTPHIKPPAGPGSHSQAPENVSRQRTLAKERTSMTMHGKVSEASRYPSELNVLAKRAAKTTEFKTAEKPIEFGLAPKAPDSSNLPAKFEKPDIEKMATTAVDVATDIIPYVRTAKDILRPTPAGAGEDEFARQAALGLKPKQTKQTGTELKTLTPQKAIELPKIQIKTEPKVEVPVKVPEPVTKAEPKVEPKVEPKDVNQTTVVTKTATATPPLPPPPPEKKSSEDKDVPSFPSPSSTKDYGYDVLHRLGVKKSRGIAKAHRMHEESERKQIENVPRKGDRKSIAYVGRSEDDPKTAKEKTSRQAAYKINVIDENKKLAGIVLSAVKDKKQQMKARTEDGLGQSSKNIEYPNGTVVSINPELSRTTMDIDGKLPNDYK